MQTGWQHSPVAPAVRLAMWPVDLSGRLSAQAGWPRRPVAPAGRLTRQRYGLRSALLAALPFRGLLGRRSTIPPRMRSLTDGARSDQWHAARSMECSPTGSNQPQAGECAPAGGNRPDRRCAIRPAVCAPIGGRQARPALCAPIRRRAFSVGGSGCSRRIGSGSVGAFPVCSDGADALHADGSRFQVGRFQQEAARLPRVSRAGPRRSPHPLATADRRFRHPAPERPAPAATPSGGGSGRIIYKAVKLKEPELF